MYTQRTKNTYFLLALLLTSALAATAFWFDDYSAQTPNCSYLNPFLVDILAFIGSLALIIDALYHAAEVNSKKQWCFILLRFIIGVTVFTFHVYQVAHKLGNT